MEFFLFIGLYPYILFALLPNRLDKQHGSLRPGIYNILNDFTVPIYPLGLLKMLKSLYFQTTNLEYTIQIKPVTNNKNINAIRKLVPFGAPLNSLQINTPHAAAIMVAP